MSCTQNITNLSTFCKTTSNSSSFSLVPEPEALRIFRIVVFGLIAAFALVGNFVVCRAVWKNPGPKVAFAHYLVSNLAFAEIVSMICLVFTFHAYEPPYSWRLGRLTCKILEPLQISSLLVVTTTLAIVAVYRCVLLIKSVVTKPTRRQTWCAILITWVGSVGLSLPAGHFRVVNSYGEDGNVHYCEEVFPEEIQHHQNTYSIVLFIVNFVLPFVIMAISYFLVTKKIREHIFVLKRIKEEENNVATLSCVSPTASTLVGNTQGTPRKKHSAIHDLVRKSKVSPSSQHSSTRNSKDVIELENDLLRMVYAVMLTFIICYIPYQVQFLMIEFNVTAFRCWPHRYTFNRIVFTLTCLPSALHPLFYGLMSRFYKDAFVKLTTACRSSQ